MASRSFAELLKQANSRLKAAKVRVSIVQRGNRLYVRGTFPSKPGSSKKRPHQQELALKINANPQGLQQAEKEAKKIGAALDLKEFSWSDYISTVTPPSTVLTVAEAVARFEDDYFQIRRRTPKTEESWRVNYQTFLKRLPQEQPLSIELLIQTILDKTEPDSSNRARICVAFKKLAQFMGCDSRPIERLKGSYSSQKSCPRDLPSDEEIIERYYQISSPEWRWVYGMMATYGLRPHEVFYLDTQALESGDITIKVLEGTKTGARVVFPLYEEWIELFMLRERPFLKPWGSCNSEVGGNVSKQFRKSMIPFPPYNLRHAWAVRSLRERIEVTLAARWMGHSVDVHTQTYHRWIASETEREMYDRAVRSKADKPLVSNFSLPHPESNSLESSLVKNFQPDLPPVPPIMREQHQDLSLPKTQSPTRAKTEPTQNRKRKARSAPQRDFEQLDLWAI